MSMQKELREWADKTAKGYVSIANDYGETAPSFYTQSDLTKIKESPIVLILGINPGSEGLYIDQKTSTGWGLNGSDIDGDHLILGNYFVNNGGSSWSDRENWPYWQRLKAYFVGVKPVNPLDDENKFILSNVTFFNSERAKNIKSPLFFKSIPYSVELIRITKPKKIIFLGGKGMLDKLNRFNRNNQLFDMSYEMINPRVCKGKFNGISFLAVPHPSAHLYREERQTVVDCITEFMD